MIELSPPEEKAVGALLCAFGADRTAARVLHRSQGITVEAIRGHLPIILKAMASTSGATDALQARLDWMHYLRQNGMNVPALIESARGNMLEGVELAGTFYTAYAYEKIPITAESHINWNDAAMPPRLGEVMGRMHRLSRSYRPKPGRPHLVHIEGADLLWHPEEAFHPSQAAVFAPIARLRDTIVRLPKDADNYGIIHDDLHTGNVFYVNDRLAVLDFDCCHYSWFAADISSALLFRVWIAPEKESRKEEAASFLKGVAQGYLTQNELPPGWIEMLPRFLKLREILLFWSFYCDMDACKGEGDRLFWYLFDSIGKDRAFLDIDFEAVV